MRAQILTVLLAVAACAPMPQTVPQPVPLAEAPPPVPGALMAGQQQAFFASFPDTLLQAAVAACSSPGQMPQQPMPGSVRCETLPTPDAAAALILSYDGTVAALPLYIVSFDARASGLGYLVLADSYVTVPQTDGTTRQIRLLDPQVDAGMMELLVAAGGQPVNPAQAGAN